MNWLALHTKYGIITYLTPSHSALPPLGDVIHPQLAVAVRGSGFDLLLMLKAHATSGVFRRNFNEVAFLKEILMNAYGYDLLHIGDGFEHVHITLLLRPSYGYVQVLNCPIKNVLNRSYSSRA